jgi:hypothetical protein
LPTTSSSEDSSGTTLMVLTSEAGTSSGTTTEASSSESTGAPNDVFDFEDDFERPDAADIGNDWVEKTPAALSLVQGALRRTAGTTPFQNNLVYRPDDVWADAEAVLSLTFDADDVIGYPQFVLRAQLDDIDVPGSVTGYLLYVDDMGLLQVTRQIAGEFTLEETAILAGPLIAGVPYRLRMRVEGTDPAVQVDGWLEEQQGDRWFVHTEVHMIDDAIERITTPGTLAVGGHTVIESWSYHHVGLYDLGP